MLYNFDEANKATEEMFEQAEQPSFEDAEADNLETETSETESESIEEVDETLVTTEPPVPPESATSGITDSEQALLDEATQTAQVAAQAAAEKENELQQIRQELEAVKHQNEQLQGTINELSRQNQENIVEEVLEPPLLDVNALAFADEDTIKAAQEKYAEDMAAYNRTQIMKELSPALEYAKQGMREKEKADVISVLSQIPELSHIKEMLPQLDRIIANNKWLQSDDMPMDEKYINAFTMARGINSINTPPPEPAKEPTVEELMALYESNPEFQDMVEKKRIEQVKDSQQVPPFSASSGAVNAALNIKEKPKTFDEASERTRKMFGLD